MHLQKIYDYSWCENCRQANSVINSKIAEKEHKLIRKYFLMHSKSYWPWVQ